MIYFLLYLINLIYILSIDIPFTLSFSFLLNLSLCFYFFKLVIKEKRFNPLLITTSIFYYTFFLIAPIIQLSSDSRNIFGMYKIDYDSAIIFNFLIFLFHLIFIIVLRAKKERVSFKILNSPVYKTNKLLIGLSLLSLILSIPFIVSTFGEQADVTDEKFVSLIFSKFIMAIPFFCLLKFLSGPLKMKKNVFPIVVLLLIVLITKNPIFEKRNAVGPVYLTIIFVFFRQHITSNARFFNLTFFLFIIMFPLASLVTNSTKGGRADVATKVDLAKENILEVSSFDKFILDHFNSFHYDAWVNGTYMYEYSNENGITWGNQLLGSVFFFIPRKFWPDKPNGSGKLIAQNKLMSQYGLSFDNISAPYIGEGYINFGLVGVIIFAILLGYGFRFLNTVSKKSEYHMFLLIFISFYLFFFLRGDLQNAIAFLSGYICAFLVVEWIVNRSFKKAIIKHNRITRLQNENYY